MVASDFSNDHLVSIEQLAIAGGAASTRHRVLILIVLKALFASLQACGLLQGCFAALQSSRRKKSRINRTAACAPNRGLEHGKIRRHFSKAIAC